ncbi:MAG: nicotinate-nucleotide adenylyltransferase [Phycisphaerales bacterium]|nr:MAG: nicotinate-nucleotide adenylyltransferase [Phycisphaerales bacterium]
MVDRIALFGGSFDPIHNGHLIIARAIAEQLGLDKVVFLPSARPPHKSPDSLASPAHRASMVELAIEGDALFEFSDFDLSREGPSYTIDTVDHFRRELCEKADLVWIIGADSIEELPTWREVDRLLDACRIVTAARASWEKTDWGALCQTLGEARVSALRADIVRTPVIEISSTEIRDRLRAGLPIRYLVPAEVRTYIEQHRLYRNS